MIPMNQISTLAVEYMLYYLNLYNHYKVQEIKAQNQEWRVFFLSFFLLEGGTINVFVWKKGGLKWNTWAHDLKQTGGKFKTFKG